MSVAMIDVDSTLTDSEKTFARIAKELDIDWINRAYFWFQPQDAGVDRQTLSNMFRRAHSREEFMKQKPYLHSQEVLSELSAMGWDIYYVSNRHPQAQRTLEEWISESGYPQPGNVLAIKDKLPWITEMKPKIVIDDRIRTMIHARSLGCEVFSIEHRHNMNLRGGEVPGIHLCADWLEIRSAIHKYLGETNE
jgi:hypothetical protein